MNNERLIKYGYVGLVFLFCICFLVIYFIFFAIYNNEGTAYWFGLVIAIFVLSLFFLFPIAAQLDRKNVQQQVSEQSKQDNASNAGSPSNEIIPHLKNGNQESDPGFAEPDSAVIQRGNEEVSLSEIPHICNPMPEDLFERACGDIVARYGFFPIECRGIHVQKKLVSVTMEILNSSADKKLPQNCRNDTRENTPDGLDRRIKEYLDSDLRTANIITDILESVGIVSNIQVWNEETGRFIKGSQLNPSWCWEPQNNRTSLVNTPTISEIKNEIRIYRNSLQQEPSDAGTWRAYESALLRLHNLDTREYNIEKSRKYTFISCLLDPPHEPMIRSRGIRRKHVRISLDEVGCYLERKMDSDEYD